MYKIDNIVYTKTRGDFMKKTIETMALGMGIGAAAYFMYDKCKNGELTKMVNQSAKEITKATSKVNKKNNDSN